MKRPLCGFLLCSSIFAASTARASHFDSQGALVFDPDALATRSFETGAAPAGGAAIVVDPSSVNGTHLLRIPAGDFTTLNFDLPPRDLAVTVSLYARGGPTSIDVAVSFHGPGIPYAGGSLFPTGRVTSDGSIEMKTAPMSLPMHRGSSVALTFLNSSSQSADIDGIEVAHEGTFREARTCSPPDASTCARGDVCAIGYCLDEAPYLPPLPAGADRANLPSWIGTGLNANFGGVHSRKAGLPGALATLHAMESATDATTYWFGLTAAIQNLHDSHSIPVIGFAATEVIPLCFVQGDADLSHRQAPSDPVYPDVLVSHGLAGQMAGLVPGDRLVAINGVHPIAFMRSLVGLATSNTQSTDPTEYMAEVDALGANIRQWATTITVVHCDPTTKVCSRPHTIPVTSLPAVPYAAAPECDNRPSYHLASGGPDPATHDLNNDVYFGPLADTSPDEALYGMIWDSLAPNPGPDPYQGPLAAIVQEASGVVLDARAGFGGGFQYASEISAPFLPTNTLTVTWQDQPFFADPAWSRADGVTEFNMLENVNPFAVGSSSPKPGLKAAVLVSMDVSADDFFAYGMRGGINGASNVRSFGTKSCGAYAEFVRMTYAGQNLWFSFGAGESFTPTGLALDGTGAEPDEYVVPLQSDLLAGRDTAYERALAWLRCTTCDVDGGTP